MKYDSQKFNNAVSYYTGYLKGKAENRVTFVVIELENKEAFFSIAPLARAVHNLKGDLHVVVKDKKSPFLDILKEAWQAYAEYKEGLKTKKAKALKDFIAAVNKRTKSNMFEEIFTPPDICLKSSKSGFEGTLNMAFQPDWHREYRWKDLLATAQRILGQGYNLKQNERYGIGFVLVPSTEHTELPLEDYLDSYSIAYTMALAAKKMGANVGLSATTDRFSILAKAVRTADLATTLRGCELDKNINEEVFRKFRVLSKLLRMERMEIADASFGIHAKGYYGKHFFGEEIGYPSANRKTRWSSPGQMMLKDRYSPQTALEPRPPLMRYAITETIPLDIYIETCNLDYFVLTKKSEKIKKIFDQCEYVRVVGREMHGYKTDFRVDLLTREGKRREFISSDCDVRSKVEEDFYKKTGIKAGKFANFPSGECFVTPERVNGTMIGDVVINVDRSYRIPAKEPLLLKFSNKGWKLIKGNKKILNVIKKQKREAWKKIILLEKSGSLPKKIIQDYKDNFNRVGEFSVNTNPKAKVCDYLIVNEKIARMMHLALGMGFEPERKTTYHWDIVVNAPRQKMDIYGVDKAEKMHWVLKKGKMVV